MSSFLRDMNKNARRGHALYANHMALLCSEFTPPKTNIAPENGWLEEEIYTFSFWDDLFSGAQTVSFREGIDYIEWWYPQIIHFNRVFHYKPSILGYLYF